jgi:hypothetical protein
LCAREAEIRRNLLNLYTEALDLSPSEQVLHNVRSHTERKARKEGKTSMESPQSTQSSLKWIYYPVPLYKVAAIVLLALATGFFIFGKRSTIEDYPITSSDRFRMGLSKGQLMIQVDLDNLNFVPAASVGTEWGIFIDAGDDSNFSGGEGTYSAQDTL